MSRTHVSSPLKELRRRLVEVNEHRSQPETHPPSHSGTFTTQGITFSIGSSVTRRLETLAAASFSLYAFLPLLWACLVAAFVLFVFPLTFMPMVIYIACIIRGSGPMTGKRSPWLRGASWWQSFADFFPVTLVKTAPLPPDGRYVIGYHPHGIISVGAFAAFCTEGVRAVDLTKQGEHPGSAEYKRGWNSLFPGLDRRLVTLPMNFRVPFLREYFLSLGLMSSSRSSFRNVLAANGNALAVVVGGADEAQMTEPHTMRLVLKKRKGFVREALISGASLVPTVAFGENDLYGVTRFESNHPIHKVQAFVLRNFGFSLPIFRGRSIFCHDFGLLPTRQPVTIVVGKPIPVPTIDGANFRPKWDSSGTPANDASKLVDEIHQRYLDALRQLARQYKREDWNVPGKEMVLRQESLQILK